MFCVKFYRVWLSLILLALPLPAQWEIDSRATSAFDHPGMCRDIKINVKDSMGRTITGASIVMDDSTLPFMTDLQGIATIPCSLRRSLGSVMEIQAPGYYPYKTMTAASETPPDLDVFLNKRDSMVRADEMTIGAQELRASVIEQSRDLQQRASDALKRKDYGTAENQLLQALELTPSSAAIINNLGVLAIHRNDPDAAGSWFEKAAKLAPYKADIVGNLGIVRWMQHRKEESYDLLRSARAMGYETSSVDYILGAVSLEKGLYAEAAERLKKVSSEQHHDRDLLLSIALRNLDKAKAAEKAYRNYMKNNPVPAGSPDQENPASAAAIVER